MGSCQYLVDGSIKMFFFSFLLVLIDCFSVFQVSPLRCATTGKCCCYSKNKVNRFIALIIVRIKPLICQQVFFFFTLRPHLFAGATSRLTHVLTITYQFFFLPHHLNSLVIKFFETACFNQVMLTVV